MCCHLICCSFFMLDFEFNVFDVQIIFVHLPISNARCSRFIIFWTINLNSFNDENRCFNINLWSSIFNHYQSSICNVHPSLFLFQVSTFNFQLSILKVHRSLLCFVRNNQFAIGIAFDFLIVQTSVFKATRSKIPLSIVMCSSCFCINLITFQLPMLLLVFPTCKFCWI